MSVRRFRTSLLSQGKSYGVLSGRGLLVPVANGGSVADVGGYRIHSFTSVGSTNFTVVANLSNVEYLIVAAGGGGKSSGSCCVGGSGAGAGGYLVGNGEVLTQTYSIVVGGGQTGLSGQNSSAIGITATGGGKGSRFTTSAPFDGIPETGGSGAGGTGLVNNFDGGFITGRLGTPGQGNKGGDYFSGEGTPSDARGGGGGGAGGPGGEGGGISTRTAVGGPGLSNTIRGTGTVFYAGGGGGSVRINAGTGTGAAGGVGGGGKGADVNGTGAANGTANTGGGAGASSGGNSAQGDTTGGSGIVVLRYLITGYQYD